MSRSANILSNAFDMNMILVGTVLMCTDSNDLDGKLLLLLLLLVFLLAMKFFISNVVVVDHLVRLFSFIIIVDFIYGDEDNGETYPSWEEIVSRKQEKNGTFGFVYKT